VEPDMTPNELISIVANNLGDGGFVSLNRDEYLAFMNDVGHDIWLKSKAMHQIRHYPLAEGLRAFVIPDTDIIEFVELQVRTVSTTPQPGDPEPEIYDSTQTPVHQQEKSVHQNIAQGQGIWTNVGNVIPHHHLTIEFRNGQYFILSPRPFHAGAVLHVHAVIHSPRYAWLDQVSAVDPVTGLDGDGAAFTETLSTALWEPLRNVFTEGCTWRAARRLSNFTQDVTRRKIWDDAKDLYYNMYLPDAIHFIHSLKESSSVMHVAPGRYLDE
jgi:hypothetical protein